MKDKTYTSKVLTSNPNPVSYSPRQQIVIMSTLFVSCKRLLCSLKCDLRVLGFISKLLIYLVKKIWPYDPISRAMWAKMIPQLWSIHTSTIPLLGYNSEALTADFKTREYICLCQPRIGSYIGVTTEEIIIDWFGCGGRWIIRW